MFCCSDVQTSPSRAHVSHLQPSELFPTAPLGCTAEQEQAARQFLLLLNSTIKNILPGPSLLTAQTPFLTEFHRFKKAHPPVVCIRLLSREVQMEKRTSLKKGGEFGIRGLWIRRFRGWLVYIIYLNSNIFAWRYWQHLSYWTITGVAFLAIVKLTLELAQDNNKPLKTVSQVNAWTKYNHSSPPQTWIQIISEICCFSDSQWHLRLHHSYVKSPGFERKEALHSDNNLSNTKSWV